MCFRDNIKRLTITETIRKMVQQKINTFKLPVTDHGKKQIAQPFCHRRLHNSHCVVFAFHFQPSSDFQESNPFAELTTDLNLFYILQIDTLPQRVHWLVICCWLFHLLVYTDQFTRY